MRILMACEFYAPSIGGVQEVSRQLAERLVERGHQVTVATTRLAARARTRINGVRIAEFSASGNLASGMYGEVDAYREYVLDSDCDVLMINAAQQWTLDALVEVLDRLEMPKVLIPCGFSRLYDPAFGSYYRRMPEILRRFDHLVFNASAYRDIDFARQHGMSNFSIVPNGASEREFLVPRDMRFRSRHCIPDDAFVALTVGSLSGQKGHRELAMAFARARFPGGRAVLVLNGNEPARVPGAAKILRAVGRGLWGGGVSALLRRALRALARRARGWAPWPEESLPRLVRRIERSRPELRVMLVDLPRDELVQAYMNSDLFVFASWVEYSPLVLFESAAAGLPFLSVPVGNAEEIARWTGAGEICDAARDELGYTRVDTERFAAHMSSLSANHDALRSYQETGRQRWQEKFTWAKITDRYEEILLRLASEKTGDADARSRPALVQPVHDR